MPYQMRMIHKDELPERCRSDIRCFFARGTVLKTDHRRVGGSDRKPPEEYLILARKEKQESNYSKWQTSFLHKSDLEMFIKYHPHYNRHYYLVEI